MNRAKPSPAFILSVSPSILFIPGKKRRWVLRRVPFQRTGIIPYFFLAGDERDERG